MNLQVFKEKVALTRRIGPLTLLPKSAIGGECAREGGGVSGSNGGEDGGEDPIENAGEDASEDIGDREDGGGEG